MSSPQRTSHVQKVERGFTALNPQECEIFDEKKETVLEVQVAARKERDTRIRERQEKAMADAKFRMKKLELQENKEKDKLLRAQQQARE